MEGLTTDLQPVLCPGAGAEGRGGQGCSSGEMELAPPPSLPVSFLYHVCFTHTYTHACTYIHICQILILPFLLPFFFPLRLHCFLLFHSQLPLVPWPGLPLSSWALLFSCSLFLSFSYTTRCFSITRLKTHRLGLLELKASLEETGLAPN